MKLELFDPVDTQKATKPQEKLELLPSVRLANPYQGLDIDTVNDRSQVVYDTSTRLQVPFGEVEDKILDAEDINIHSRLTSDAPEIPIEDNPTNQFGLTAGMTTGRNARKRTLDETIEYNLNQIPKGTRERFLALSLLPMVFVYTTSRRTDISRWRRPRPTAQKNGVYCPYWFLICEEGDFNQT